MSSSSRVENTFRRTYWRTEFRAIFRRKIKYEYKATSRFLRVSTKFEAYSRIFSILFYDGIRPLLLKEKRRDSKRKYEVQ
jgi:hypothetical protein